MRQKILLLMLIGWFFIIFGFPMKGGELNGYPQAFVERTRNRRREILFYPRIYLGPKFFDYRKRPVIRVAVFDFTDGSEMSSRGERN